MATESVVLLTGLTGYIAKHTALALLAAGYRVRGTVRDTARAKPMVDGLAKLASERGLDPSRLSVAAADLMSDAGWSDACAGCAYVVHMASPFPLQNPPDRMALVPPARDGTLRVLRAASAAGVRRVALTSSVASIVGGHPLRPGHLWTEADWSDVDAKTINPYRISKTLAERAAWEEVKKSGLDLVSLNPAFVLGPGLDRAAGASLELVVLLMKGKYPAVPDLSFAVVDARDVADAHVAALTAEGAVGHRFILAGEGLVTIRDMGRWVGEAIPEVRGKMPRFTLPDWLVRAVAKVDKTVAVAVPDLGRRELVSNEAARRVLGVTFRSNQEAVVSAARSVREHGLA
ncbi:MAG: NAD-dependent epimerase/dehydratase family protein [Polyangiaceae bacterium]